MAKSWPNSFILAVYLLLLLLLLDIHWLLFIGFFFKWMTTRTRTQNDHNPIFNEKNGKKFFFPFFLKSKTWPHDLQSFLVSTNKKKIPHNHMIGNSNEKMMTMTMSNQWDVQMNRIFFLFLHTAVNFQWEKFFPGINVLEKKIMIINQSKKIEHIFCFNGIFFVLFCFCHVQESKMTKKHKKKKNFWIIYKTIRGWWLHMKMITCVCVWGRKI